MGSDTHGAPGHRRQGQARTGMRVIGVVSLLAGLYLLVTGFGGFVMGMDGDDMDGSAASMLRFAGGGLLLVVGFGTSSLGFMGAGARYASGETAPVVKDTAAYLTDGAGLLGVGRTGSAAPAGGTGPFCRSCGTSNDAEARFCDGCGSSMS